MIDALAYIAANFLQRLVGFFVHWYADGTRFFLSSGRRLLATHKNLFVSRGAPGLASLLRWALFFLWGTIAGALFILALAALYLVWVFTPPFILFKTISESLL